MVSLISNYEIEINENKGMINEVLKFMSQCINQELEPWTELIITHTCHCTPENSAMTRSDEGVGSNLALSKIEEKKKDSKEKPGCHDLLVARPP